MSHQIEEKLQSLVHDAEERERKARKRAVIYSLVPVVFAGLLIWFTGWQIKQMQVKVNALSEEAARYRGEATELKGRVVELNKNLEETRKQLRGAREATDYVKQGIELYHNRRYIEAVEAYNDAVSLDPQNAYILNLKGYSLFKAKRFDESVATLRKAVEVEPNYAWGYFDLARAECARGNYNEASNVIKKAIERRPDLKDIMRSDGEFTRLCAPVLKELK